MIHVAILLLSLGGFASLLLAMPRHQQDWLHGKLGATACNIARRSGFMLLALAFVVAGGGLGWGYGAVAWFGWLSVAAAIVVTANLNRARLLHLARKVRP